MPNFMESHPGLTLCKTVAHVLGGGAMLFFGAYAVTRGIPELLDGHEQQLNVIVWLAGASGGLVLAYWWQQAGGGLAMAGAFLLGATVHGLAGPRLALLFALPFFVPGAMHVICVIRARRRIFGKQPFPLK